jgi:hypothetical protein
MAAVAVSRSPCRASLRGSPSVTRIFDLSRQLGIVEVERSVYRLNSPPTNSMVCNSPSNYAGSFPCVRRRHSTRRIRSPGARTGRESPAAVCHSSRSWRTGYPIKKVNRPGVTRKVPYTPTSTSWPSGGLVACPDWISLGSWIAAERRLSPHLAVAPSRQQWPLRGMKTSSRRRG